MGLGTAAIPNTTLETIIQEAYNNGCTLIDTANAYISEKYVGDAVHSLVNKNVLKRDDLFITSKIGDKLNKKSRPIGYYFYNSPSSPVHDVKRIVYEQVERSLSRLHTDYIDLMLVHWPYYEVLNEIWKCMEELYEQKILKSIGVSNCKKRHIERILTTANYVPMVNQFNISPINLCLEDYMYCKENNILMEAYSPLYALISPIKNDYIDELNLLALKYKKSSAQIILRWYYQKGIVPIPKTSNPKRVKENYDIFDFFLNVEDMNMIDSLNKNYNILVESIFCPGY